MMTSSSSSSRRRRRMMMMMMEGRKSGEEEVSLRQRVLSCLKKVGDRDTHQMGSEELERIAEGLSPEGIGPFLSCILLTDDHDGGRPAAVRRECVRLLGVLARSHPQHILHHHHQRLSKVVSSIVRRLRDPDTLVRDACVQACGVLAAAAASASPSSSLEAILTPLFQALTGEQNRYVQAGSALCLAAAIRSSSSSSTSSSNTTSCPPATAAAAAGHQMLPRLVKLLNNPHFIAKAAIIHLLTTLLEAGCAPTEHSLSPPLNAVLQTLKSADWTTRKAASVALATISSSSSVLPLASFRNSCIASLEASRFDKVKPVRDAILHALQCWKSLPAAATATCDDSPSPRPSEAGSSTKGSIQCHPSPFTSSLVE